MAETRPVSRNRFKIPAFSFKNCLLLCVLLPCPAFTAADDLARQQHKLDDLRKRITTIKSDVERVRGQQSAEQQRLEKTEKEIGGINAELHRLDGEALTARQQIASLAQARTQEQQLISTLQQALTRELQSAYAAGRQQRIKLLLNQQEPATLGRMLSYQGYLARARGLRLQQVHTAIAGINETGAQLLAQQAEIARIRARQAERAAALGSEQAKRQRLLQGMQQELQQKSGTLTGLQADEEQLQALLKTLQEALRQLPAGAGDAVSLQALKGKLSWPVAGNITRRYGTQHTLGAPPSKGLFIATVAGADVLAIAPGRVAFADWLRGFGLLLILDHGDGYMSLYGQNRGLYRQVGDWVNRGEVVAAAGNSGGQLSNGLYLELRHNGRPFNPMAWFRGKPLPLQAGH